MSDITIFKPQQILVCTVHFVHIVLGDSSFVPFLHVLDPLSGRDYYVEK